MELSKCLGCMEDLQGYPCPHCGYDPVKEKRPEYALPPETILAGKYLVGRVLGQGGFGITYIGWDIALERKVAIKEYYPSGQVSRSPGTRSLTWYTNEPAVQAREDGMKMFLKEARKMVKADSIPGVVRVLDLFQENGTAYIVMDFVSGETLKTRLQKTGPMTWTQAAPIFQPAIRAMEQVHQAGLIHRDLSPDNLMLTPSGDVKILDLGAAKDLNLNSGASSMQVAKSGFSPLEQYTQRGGSGPWTDVYSMAATIYYALTGKLLPIAIDRVEEDTIDWAQPRLDTLPSEALEALKKALAVSVKQRTQSMEDLERGLFGEPKQKTEPIPPSKAKQEPQTEPDAISQTIPQKQNVKKSGKKHWVIATIIAAAMALCGIGCWMGAAQESATSPALTDTTDVSGENARKNLRRETISAGDYHTVALKSDGTVVAVGDNSENQCDVSRWRDIVAVSANELHTVGLKSDGTVVAVGNNTYGRCNVLVWQNAISVSAGYQHTVALKSSGSVAAVGDNSDGQCEVYEWQNIVAVSAGSFHTVGLKADGTVVATGFNGCGQCNVSRWQDVVAVSAGWDHTVALKADGTVVATGYNEFGQCDVSGWQDIVAVSAGSSYTVGLKSDGTVVATGYNEDGQCDVSGWRDIVAVSAGSWDTVGLKSDGTVVAVGDNSWGQCEVFDWQKIHIP